MPESIYDKLGEYLSQTLDSGFFSSEMKNKNVSSNDKLSPAEQQVIKLKRTTTQQKAALKAMDLDESYTYDQALNTYNSLKKQNPANKMLDIYFAIIKEWYEQ